MSQEARIPGADQSGRWYAPHRDLQLQFVAITRAAMVLADRLAKGDNASDGLAAQRFASAFIGFINREIEAPAGTVAAQASTLLDELVAIGGESQSNKDARDRLCLGFMASAAVAYIAACRESLNEPYRMLPQQATDAIAVAGVLALLPEDLRSKVEAALIDRGCEWMRFAMRSPNARCS